MSDVLSNFRNLPSFEVQSPGSRFLVIKPESENLVMNMLANAVTMYSTLTLSYKNDTLSPF